MFPVLIRFGMMCLPKSTCLPPSAFFHHVAVEDVDAHGGEEEIALAAVGSVEGSTRSVSSRAGSCGFSSKRVIRPLAVDLHDPEGAGVGAVDRDGRDGDVGLGADVLLDQLAEVHPGRAGRRRGSDVLVGRVVEVLEILPHGVAVPWYQAVLEGVCCAAIIST